MKHENWVPSRCSSAANCFSISLVILEVGTGAVALSSPFVSYTHPCCRLFVDPCWKLCGAHHRRKGGKQERSVWEAGLGGSGSSPVSPTVRWSIRWMLVWGQDPRTCQLPLPLPRCHCTSCGCFRLALVLSQEERRCLQERLSRTRTEKPLSFFHSGWKKILAVAAWSILEISENECVSQVLQTAFVQQILTLRVCRSQHLGPN